MDIKYLEELNLICLDIENEFAPIVRKGYKLIEHIKGVNDDVEVELVEVLPNPEYKNGDGRQFAKVKIKMKQMSSDGSMQDEILEDIVLLEYVEKAKIIDEYAENAE